MSLGARLLLPAARGRDALADALARRGVTPDAVSWAAFALSLGAAWLLLVGGADATPWSPGGGEPASLLPFAACCLVTASGFLDVVDGALARRTGRASACGAFLDSTLDRVADLSWHLALAVHFARRGQDGLVALTVLAFSHGVLIAYMRARAESLGADASAAAIGFWQRSERVVLLGFAVFWGRVPEGMIVLGTLPALTAWRRFRQVRGLLRGASPSAADARPRAPAWMTPWRASRGSAPWLGVALAVLAAVLLARPALAALGRVVAAAR